MLVAIVPIITAIRHDNNLSNLLEQVGHEVVDLGVCDGRPVDYPDVAAAVATRVGREGSGSRILISGLGGMCIAANKFPGVCAVLCHDGMTAEMSRRHNDANVLCLAAGMLGESFIRHTVSTWLEAPFDGGYYARQIEKIASLEYGGRGERVTDRTTRLEGDLKHVSAIIDIRLAQCDRHSAALPWQPLRNLTKQATQLKGCPDFPRSSTWNWARA